MIKNGEPYVLEYDVRMGDPECQPIMVRIDFDLYDYFVASTEEKLSNLDAPKRKEQSAVCIVLASEGYPGSYPKKKNEEIQGFENIPDNSFVFHAGTKKENEKILTNGGGVLGVTALGDSLELAISNAYAATEKISWPHKYCRKDIGKKGLIYL